MNDGLILVGRGLDGSQGNLGTSPTKDVNNRDGFNFFEAVADWYKHRALGFH